jgi:DNA-nicking Smr family endonuclease
LAGDCQLTERERKWYQAWWSKFRPTKPFPLPPASKRPQDVFPAIVREPVALAQRLAHPCVRKAPDVPGEQVNRGDPTVTIKFDMHGFNVLPARQLVRRFVLNASPSGHTVFALIVGQGHHTRITVGEELTKL